MAEKGFNLKVLIPTDDGILISEKVIESASHYLMYNVSNRSYQLAGKINVSEFIKDDEDFSAKIDELILHYKIDNVIDFKDFPHKEINEILNELIDVIDKKTS
ncbi:MAG: hypothetical protein PF485_14720 [Bacteroidales bacterium]|jgi:hypothetical protein|nr:hypothetical protein [Bacteroidales bacterium]